MARRILTMAMIALVVLGMACGSDDDDDDDSTSSAGPTATTGSGSSSGSSNDGTYTEAELMQFGEDLVGAIASGDRDELTTLLTGVAPQERIDELAACKPAELTVDNVDVSVTVDPPSMRINGTVDVTQNGNTETKVVQWNTELSETNDGEYTFSALPSGCPFIFQ